MSHLSRGKLAPVSGSIDAEDADAYAAAAREIREETQLITDKDLRLMFRGTTFFFVDEEAQRSWTVHPFSWSLAADESKIKLDWEHSSYDWVHPRDIISRKIAGDCVPRLDWSFRRVYFGHGGIFGHDTSIKADNDAGKTFQLGLDRLRNDQENGARVLADSALECLAEITQKMDVFDWSSLRIAAYHLIYSGRPSMNAAISSAILSALDGPPLTSNVDQRHAVSSLIEKAYTDRQQASERMSSCFIRFIGDFAERAESINLLTLSSSSTVSSAVTHLLRTMSHLRLNLRILESRPLCEGVSMAAKIMSTIAADCVDRLHIQIAPDSHMARFAEAMGDPALLLLGADRISPSGHVSNKIGSLAAAIVVRKLSPAIQVVILSETDKIVKPHNLEPYETCKEDINQEIKEHSPESGSISQVMTAWKTVDLKSLAKAGDNFEVHNVYFEWVHRDLIDVYVSEEGLLSRKRIREISLEKAKRARQLFAGV